MSLNKKKNLRIWFQILRKKNILYFFLLNQALNVEKFQELIKSSWKLSKNFTEDIKQ